jgi:hypothetical protein
MNQCEHGSLARQCLVCELQAEVERLRDTLRRIRDDHQGRCVACQSEVCIPECELAEAIGPVAA